MSQRMTGCCCGKCVNAALGACCIKPTTSTAGCLGDCEGFDPTDGTPVGILSNLTAAQCTQAGIDYGLNTVFTVYPNCAPMEICNCIESMTECACANMNGIWNGSTSCTTGCLGSCCVRDLSGQRISCHDLMTECDCNKLKSTTQTTLWTVGLNCINSPCSEPCGPDLCLGGNNGSQNILLQRTRTSTVDNTFRSLNGTVRKFKEQLKVVEYINSNRAEYDYVVSINPYKNGPITYRYIDSEYNNTTVVNITYSIRLIPSCIEFGCLPNLTYIHRQYEGHCEGGPSDRPYSGTFTAGDGGTVAYGVQNACLFPYQIDGVDWWTNIYGQPTCPVSAECQAKLNAYKIFQRTSVCIPKNNDVTTGSEGFGC